jgi:transposase
MSRHIKGLSRSQATLFPEMLDDFVAKENPVIATNDLSEDMTMGKMLSTYKEQQSIEKGFRFLKSPDF